VGTTGAAGASAATLEPRIAELEVPTGAGKRIVIDQIQTGSYVLAGGNHVIRYHVELDNDGAGFWGQYCILVTGLSYLALDSTKRLVNLMFGGYFTSADALVNPQSDNLNSSSTVECGTYVSSNGKLTIWWETANHYGNFAIEAIQQDIGQDIAPGATISFTEVDIEL
jgi:hypothetical protein